MKRETNVTTPESGSNATTRTHVPWLSYSVHNNSIRVQYSNNNIIIISVGGSVVKLELHHKKIFSKPIFIYFMLNFVTITSRLT